MNTELNETLSFDERQVLEIYRENKETGKSSLLLPSKSLPLISYLNSVRISSKALISCDMLLDNSAAYFLCYGYIQTSTHISLEEVDREVSKAAELGLLGFEQPSQPGKVCCITDVCIYKNKTNRFNGRAPLVGLTLTNLRLERFGNLGVFAYPFFKEYAPAQLWPFLRPKSRIIINHISATDVSLGDSCDWESKIDDSMISNSYQRASRFRLFR